MCDYTEIRYSCNGVRYQVKAWCTKYQETHRRCPTNVVTIKLKPDDICSLDNFLFIPPDG
ncbi:hypothetical protein P154DRAFT_431479 [Amniculicola lignicola CBS 123094]|uniref:Uncharacterized protein n=1 Tax=Amniculicola lignicola CBS 123094 TaxID=1392246 RepID=A0A6A5WMM4_9PLEO|nr:hypothetical protein P154DRAFT_431479 [Amniculicola lignicola CBS 123094]